MSVINIDNFFNFDNHTPVNRIAYSEEDAKYKLMCMKAMQDLGMKILIDDVGNIVGELPANYSKNKNLVMGSHTDSVTNGGQFDGPVGVYMSLKASENFKKSNNKQYGNLKTIIYACEESTRFSTACIGSYYLNGNFSKEYLSTLTDKNGISFNVAVSEYKAYIFSHLAEYGIDLNNIKLVDKVITPDEISEALEAHIEQSEILSNNGKSIGIIDSIGKPVRGNITIHGQNSIVTSARIIDDLTTLAKESKSKTGEEAIRITVPKFNTLDDEENQKAVTGNMFLVSATGESNHSGATPMDARRDSVLGLSKLVLGLNDFQNQHPEAKIDFLGTVTPKWGANQIQDRTYLIIKVEPEAYNPIVKAYSEDLGEESNVHFDMLPITKTVVPKDLTSELFVDIRQQYPVTPETTKARVFDIFKNIQDKHSSDADSISFRVTSEGEPIKTSSELLENVKDICDEKNYPCQIMHSWPGHDLACILDPDCTTRKRILFFIPSKGGSHNPKETTTREAIEIGSDVFTTLTSKRMNKFKEEYEKEAVLEK